MRKGGIMKKEEILAHVDHTLLRVDATEEEICLVTEDAAHYRTASVCVPPLYVKAAARTAAGRVPVCTVIGFPNGYSTTAVKVAEATEAIADGASEIDMVIAVGMVKSGDYHKVFDDIAALRKATKGKILKVIIETCLLTDAEKIRMAGIVSEAGADYIKTSTGFAGCGATLHDVELLARHVSGNTRVKAAGGIGSLADAEAMLKAGADRLGTSRIVDIIKKEERNGI